MDAIGAALGENEDPGGWGVGWSSKFKCDSGLSTWEEAPVLSGAVRLTGSALLASERAFSVEG